MLNGKRITLLMSGSIAAYKCGDIVRELVKRGAKVQVAMTESATHFITPLTLQTLSQHPVTTKLLDEGEEGRIGHIRLADETDLVLVAPASANLLARAAMGIADDAPTAILLATRAPVVIAPAMNVNMWNHPATVRNIEILKSFGHRFVEPATGELACGWWGAGRLAELDTIIAAVTEVLHSEERSKPSEQPLARVRVVVTAGPTREPIDPIRFITNASTGTFGFALAASAIRMGGDVVLISGPSSCQVPPGVDLRRIETALEMRSELWKVISEIPPGDELLVCMAAAVSDHRPESVSPTKVKHDKSKSYELRMVPNPDLLQEVGEWRKSEQRQNTTLVGFSAETTSDEQELMTRAREKLEKKQVDYIVSNTVPHAFGNGRPEILITGGDGNETRLASDRKEVLADKLLAYVTRREHSRRGSKP